MSAPGRSDPAPRASHRTHPQHVNLEINLKSSFLASSLLAALGFLGAGQADATNLFNPTVSTTTVLDGASIELDGTLNDTLANSQPWVAELFAGIGECVRFFVTTTAFDAKITVVTPHGVVYRDDDSGGSLRPLVEINGAPVSGWYTVQVSQFTGQPQNANFALKYGRYNFGNPNCGAPTSPLSVPNPGEQVAKQASATAAALPGAETDPSGAR
jgi:hypothetical protein